jgi:hypothetical protein
LAASLAIFATIFVAAMPTDTASPVAARTRWRSSRPIASGGPRRLTDAVTSMNASSSDSGSTSGLTLAKIFCTSRLTRWYFFMSPRRNTASGQRRCASAAGIAEWMPNTRASYDAAVTTPRLAVPPTTTGRPRSSGWSRCSIAA